MKRNRSLTALASHNLTVLSAEAVANIVEAVRNLTSKMADECASDICTNLLVSKSQRKG
jgi:predicted neutral ceramidase superfamily lipid hydrolase